MSFRFVEEIKPESVIINLIRDKEEKPRAIITLDPYDRRASVTDLNFDGLDAKEQESLITALSDHAVLGGKNINQAGTKGVGKVSIYNPSPAAIEIFTKHGFVAEPPAQLRSVMLADWAKKTASLTTTTDSKEEKNLHFENAKADIIRKAKSVMNRLAGFSGFQDSNVNNVMNKGFIGFATACHSSRPFLSSTPIANAGDKNDPLAFCRITSLGSQSLYVGDTWVDPNYFDTDEKASRSMGTRQHYHRVATDLLTSGVSPTTLVYCLAPKDRMDEFASYGFAPVAVSTVLTRFGMQQLTAVIGLDHVYCQQALAVAEREVELAKDCPDEIAYLKRRQAVYENTPALGVVSSIVSSNTTFASTSASSSSTTSPAIVTPTTPTPTTTM